MISDVKITGMRRVMKPEPNQAGFKILAFFECDANDFTLRGCAFVRTPRGGLSVWPPKIQNPEDSRRSVTLRSERLRRDMTVAAQETYRALGGTDGEFGPCDPFQPPEKAAATAQERDRLLEVIEAEESTGMKRFLGAIATS